MNFVETIAALKRAGVSFWYNTRHDDKMRETAKRD